MILEEERIASELENLFKRRQWLEQQVRVGERYERLLSNSDFRAMLKDLEDTLKIHQMQLDVLDIELTETSSPFRMARNSTDRRMHLERMNQLRAAVRRPQQLVDLSKQAQEELIEIAKQEKELKR